MRSINTNELSRVKENKGQVLHPSSKPVAGIALDSVKSGGKPNSGFLAVKLAMIALVPEATPKARARGRETMAAVRLPNISPRKLSK